MTSVSRCACLLGDQKPPGFCPESLRTHRRPFPVPQCVPHALTPLCPQYLFSLLPAEIFLTPMVFSYTPRLPLVRALLSLTSVPPPPPNNLTPPQGALCFQVGFVIRGLTALRWALSEGALHIFVIFSASAAWNPAHSPQEISRSQKIDSICLIK